MEARPPLGGRASDAYTDPARAVEQVAGREAVLLTPQRVPVTREIIARLPELKFISQTSATQG